MKVMEFQLDGEFGPSRMFYILAQGRCMGPYPHHILVDHLMAEDIGADALVWREGMVGWVTISESEDFRGLALHVPPVSRLDHLPPRSSDQLIEDTIELDLGPESYLEPTASGDQLGPLGTRDGSHDFSGEQVEAGVKSPESTEIKTSRKRALGALMSVLGLILVMTVGVVHYISSDPIGHFLERLDEAPFRVKEIRRVLSMPIEPVGSYAWGRLRSDSRLPQILLAANLPEGSELEVLIQGRRGTLVGALSARTSFSGRTMEGILISPVLRLASGGMLPEGNYDVSVRCVDCPTGSEAVVLTDPLRIIEGSMAGYAERRAEFERNLKRQAESELAELNDMALTLVDAMKIKPLQGSSTSQGVIVQITEMLSAMSDSDLENDYLMPEGYRNLRTIFVNHQSGMSRQSTFEALQKFQLNLEKNRRLVTERDKVTEGDPWTW